MIEKEFDEMLDKIDSVNYDFVNSYFNDESDIFEMQKEIKEELSEDNDTVTGTSADDIDGTISNDELEEVNVVSNDEFTNELAETEELNTEGEKQEDSNEEPSAESESLEEELPVDKGEEAELEPNEYKNHFTSFSKTNLNKISNKRVKVYHQNNFKEKEEQIEEKKFSYNEILDRLDQERKYDLNNTNDLMKCIEKCKTSDEFFEYVESELNDK